MDTKQILITPAEQPRWCRPTLEESFGVEQKLAPRFGAKALRWCHRPQFIERLFAGGVKLGGDSGDTGDRWPMCLNCRMNHLCSSSPLTRKEVVTLVTVSRGVTTVTNGLLHVVT